MPAELSPDHVTVILSTFNGGEFLRAQLNSLHAQTHRNLSVIARDDGSSDATGTILNEERTTGRITLLTGGKNLGAAASFLLLLKHAAETNTDFVAFCDQDDVWLPEKISRAVAALASVRGNGAVLYCSRLEMVDEQLRPIGMTAIPQRIGFGNALVENVCVGCTIVLNRAAIDLLCQHLPRKILVHDWWCYLVVSCFGQIIFDPEASIRYRQHGGNVFGAAKGKLDRLKRNFKRFGGHGVGRDWQSHQAAVFLDTFGDRIPVAEQRIVRTFVEAKSNWWRRVGLVFSRDVWRQKMFDDLAWRLLALLNRY